MFLKSKQSFTNNFQEIVIFELFVNKNKKKSSKLWEFSKRFDQKLKINCCVMCKKMIPFGTENLFFY